MGMADFDEQLSRPQKRYLERHGLLSESKPKESNTKNSAHWSIFGLWLGVVSFGDGFAMSSPAYFWLTWSLATLISLFYLLYHMHRNLRGLDILIRIFSAMLILAFLFFNLYVGFRPSSASIDIFMKDIEYRGGQIVKGIEWKDNYYPVTVSLVNFSNTNYTNVKLFVRTDAIIEAAGSSLSDRCIYKPYNSGLSIVRETVRIPDKDGNLRVYDMTNTKSAIYQRLLAVSSG